MSDTPILNSKITEFYERLTRNFKHLKKSKQVPELLQPFIKKDALLHIYEQLLTNKRIQAHLKHDLLNQEPVRLEKLVWEFARTLNIIFDPQTDDICLMLETKRKTASTKHKNINTPIHSGTNKTVKPAWRIDTMRPIKYANAVLYSDEKTYFVEDSSREALYSKKLVQKYPAINIPIQKISLGALFKKTGTRALRKKHAFGQKISLYSRWAQGGDLAQFLASEEGKALTLEQKNMLAYQLLQAVKILHDEKLIHQDIKPQNIVIFIDSRGHYDLKLTDLGELYDPTTPQKNKKPQATIEYESPEIAALHFYNHQEHASLYKYFYVENQKVKSYGRDIFLSNRNPYKEGDAFKQYALPHESNDLWAVGIVLYKIFYKNKEKIPSEVSPLVAGLLTIDRAKRLTADEAFLYQQAIVEKDKKAAHEEKEEKEFKGEYERLEKALYFDPILSSKTSFTPHFERFGFMELSEHSPNNSPVSKKTTYKKRMLRLFCCTPPVD